MAMAQAPGDNSRWFAGLRDGKIVAFSAASPPASPTIVADLALLSGMPMAYGSEGGLLDFAFHPKFAQNGQLYVSWTTDGGPADLRSVVSRLTSTDNGVTFSQHSTILGPFDQPDGNHNGGGVQFGPDGFLYLSFGDGGGGSDAYKNGQTRSGFFSKILRIDVDSPPPPGATYAIPEGNPFKSGGGEPATFARGFRNPFRFTFDRGSGDLWVGDVGEARWEEINHVQLGGNYGWPCREGATEFFTPQTDPERCSSTMGLVDPIIAIEHSSTSPSRSVTGGLVYRGTSIPGLVGTYVFGDFITQELFGLSFDPTSGSPVTSVLNADGTPAASWVSFAQDAAGELFAIALEGEVYAMVPAGPQPSKIFPDRLSKTGCVDATDAKKPAPGLIPYGVNAQLWSDGASKERWLAVPDGKTISVADDGDFELPVGSVVMKTFSVAGKLVETRLLVRHDDGDWAGYDYEWNDAQTDALLLEANKTKKVGSATWYFPSRADCVRCHTAAARRTLGLELGQLNGDLTYTSTNRIANQLATLDHIGMFDTPLGTPIAQIVAYPNPLGTSPVDGRARAYLHANCSQCHRPGNPTRSDMDLRFFVPLRDTNACATAPKVDDLGVPGAKLLDPGSPGSSVLSLRVHAFGAARMPPLATSVIDAQGTALLDDWIRSLASCP
ncbi:MAG: PQQ-dependent sugar dehydrogenase [Labilithrix sp.]|nr:PQQ-dependent sugar dehydrogenase [Labilithrix sp.]